MYHDIQRKENRVKHTIPKPKESNRTTIYLLALIAVMFLLGAMYTDGLALQAGLLN